MKKKAKILFIYPNERHMSTIPPSIALFSQLLKNEGHSVALFDTTFYELDDEIKLKGSDESKVDRLTIRPDERHYRKDTKVKDTNGKKTLTVKLNPILEKDDDVLHFEYIKDNPSVDLRNKIKEFKPDLLAVTCTETTFPRGLKLIKDTKDMGIPNVFGGVFPTFAPQVCMDIKEIDMCCVGEGEKALINLVIVPAALLVCKVPSTKCPVSAIVSAALIESTSLNSPIATTSGSCLKTLFNDALKCEVSDPISR